MRAAACIALVLAALALAGCIAKTPQTVPVEQPGDPVAPSPPPSPPPAAPSVPLSAAAPAPVPVPILDPGPLVVIAHIDTGINPYHKAFRDTGPLARVHPCVYLPVYPCDTPALNLTLDAPTYEAAQEADAALWETVEAGKLYWIPGTRIAGAISFGPGGTACPGIFDIPPALEDCGLPERVIQDDHGHGTMTASRMAAGEHSLCTTCRIVTIEGLGGDAVRWAADQGWIDVQTNSWGSLVSVPVPDLPEPVGCVNACIRDAFAYAAQKMLVYVASGNGLVFHGFLGEPTFQQATEAAGVISVGAHDNGHLTLYHGQPPHVIADGYGGWRATHTSMDEFGPGVMACCTSAASPYAAGGGAASLLQARTLLGHRGTGWVEGVGAAGDFTAASGPLDDGTLTLDELRRLVLLSANPRPAEGPDDGLLHWFGTVGATPMDPTNPGENPFCIGCWATPLTWSQVPADLPLYHFVGYGAVDPGSVQVGAGILAGDLGAPERPVEDLLYAADQQVRSLLDGLP